MMRRGISRRARRLRRIAHQAALIGLDRNAIHADSGQRIHCWRAKAATERIELAQLLPVLLHIAKNRGPSGDWVYQEPKPEGKKRGGKKSEGGTDAVTVSQKNEEKKDIVGGVRKLEELIAAAAAEQGRETLTLGEYLHYRGQKGDSTTIGRAGIGLYPSRQRVESEFHRIWDTQANFYPILQDSSIKQRFFDAIFHQRPLKSPAPMVGHCPLEPTLARSPAAQMVAQEFRVEKQLADLRWGIGRSAQHLTHAQKAIVRGLLSEQGEVSFTKIFKALAEAGCPGPAGRGLNMDRSSRESLKGNTTLAGFRSLGIANQWLSLNETTQVQVINFLADLGSPDALDNEDWDRSFQTSQKDPTTGQLKRRQFTPELVSFINILRRHPKFGRLTAMGFDGGRMGYSVKALKKLTELMQAGQDERAAVDQAYPEHNKTKPIVAELPLPEETGNTVVDVALRQVYRSVKRMMKALNGPPTAVIVELSRDMALGVKKRGEIEARINLNSKTRKDAARAIGEHGQVVNDRSIHRYLLWQSQMHYCPYCDRRIELGEALSSETEREHILPRTLTRVGGKRSQLVLAHRTCNREKHNRTPWQAFGNDATRWRIIEERAAQLEKNKQWGKAKLLLLKDWEDEVLDNEAIKGFTDRQFHEGSWIAKLTAQWLRTVCPDVSVSRGELTAHLRRTWKLDTVIPQVRYESGLPVLDPDGTPISLEDFEIHRSWWEGHRKHEGATPTDRRPDKRIDHRHHLLDALITSLTSRSLYMRMAENYKHERERETHGERAKLSLHIEPPVSRIRDLAREIIRKAEVRHKPDRHPDGALFEQTAYGVSREADRNGEYLLASSKPLKSLIDIKFNAAKTRSTLERIESKETRETILREFDRRVAKGTPLKQVFDDPITHPQYGTPIKRVRILGNSAATAVEVIHVNRQGKSLGKHYAHDGNAYLEIRAEERKLVGKPRLVNIRDAVREKGFRAPDGVRRFWKGDTVIDARNGQPYLIRQIKSEGGGTLIITLVTEAREVRDMNAAGGLRKVSGNSLALLFVVNQKCPSTESF
jgi:CRISPR-associated endonuclease Csn1